MADLTPASPLAALQGALAGEHAAVWLFGFLAARVSASEEADLSALLTSAFEAHRTARDDLVVLIASRGAEPVASEVDYDPAGAATTPAQVRNLARGVEERVNRTWAEVVGGTAGDDRRLAVAALQAGAVRALGLGATPTDLPGLA